MLQKLCDPENHVIHLSQLSVAQDQDFGSRKRRRARRGFGQCLASPFLPLRQYFALVPPVAPPAVLVPPPPPVAGR